MARKVSLAAAKVASNKAALQCVISDLTASPIAYFERTSRFDPSARVHAGSRFQSTSAKASTNLTAPKVTTSWLSALFGGGTSKPKAHRPFGRHEEAHLRLATRKTNKILKANPGARVEPKFLTEEDAQMLVEEAMDIINIYGISHVSEEQRDFLASQLKHFPLPKEDLRALINMQRVTGVRGRLGVKVMEGQHCVQYQMHSTRESFYAALVSSLFMSNFSLGIAHAPP